MQAPGAAARGELGPVKAKILVTDFLEISRQRYVLNKVRTEASIEGAGSRPRATPCSGGFLPSEHSPSSATRAQTRARYWSAM